MVRERRFVRLPYVVVLGTVPSAYGQLTCRSNTSDAPVHDSRLIPNGRCSAVGLPDRGLEYSTAKTRCSLMATRYFAYSALVPLIAFAVSACTDPTEIPTLNSEQIRSMVVGNTTTGELRIAERTRTVSIYFKDTDKARVRVGEDERYETQWWVVPPGNLCFRADRDGVICHRELRRSENGYTAVARSEWDRVKRTVRRGDPSGMAAWNLREREEDWQPISKEEIEKAMVGRRFESATRGGNRAIARFRSDGTATAEFLLAGPRSGVPVTDNGTWAATSFGEVCFQFKIFAGGNRRCARVVRDGASIRFGNLWRVVK